MLILSKKILGAYPKTFCSFTVTGRRGIGKSCYSLIALHEVFMKLGFSSDASWDKALGSMKFKIIDVINYLVDAVDSDKRKVCLVWDDCGIHASGSKYFLNMKLVDQLKGVMDSVRTATVSLILTTPSTSGLLSLLKNYDDFLIKINYSDRGGYYRCGHGYLWNTLPSGQKRIYKKFIDDFSCYVPNKIYDRYYDLRKTALKSVLHRLKETVDVDE